MSAEEDPRDAATFQAAADFPQTLMPFYCAAERHTDRPAKFRRANIITNGLSVVSSEANPAQALGLYRFQRTAPETLSSLCEGCVLYMVHFIYRFVSQFKLS